jgi:hypothetical protein
MDNPEKLATYTKKNKNKKHNTICVEGYERGKP